MALPVLEDPDHVLARNTGHGGEITLLDLLTDNNPALLHTRNVPPPRAEQRAGDPAFERKETTGRHQRLRETDALGGTGGVVMSAPRFTRK